MILRDDCHDKKYGPCPLDSVVYDASDCYSVYKPGKYIMKHNLFEHLLSWTCPGPRFPQIYDPADYQ